MEQNYLNDLNITKQRISNEIEQQGKELFNKQRLVQQSVQQVVQQGQQQPVQQGEDISLNKTTSIIIII